MNANVRPCIVEFIGTFAFVFLSAGAVCADALPSDTGHNQYGKIGIALATATAWAGTLAITVRVSGGFLNPAITIMQWAFGLLDHRRALGFLAAQLLGAVLAGLALRGLLAANTTVLIASRLGTPHLNLFAFATTEVLRETLLLGIGIEALLTFVLVIGVCALHFDPRFRQRVGERASRLVYLWLGLLMFAEVLVGHSYTGAALNPARWFGTVVWELTVAELVGRKPFADHAAYWIGPMVGAVFAGLVYHYFILPPEAGAAKK